NDPFTAWGPTSRGGRESMRRAYGPVTVEQLLRARVLSLFLNAMLAIYAHAEGLRALEGEAIVGLERTMVVSRGSPSSRFANPGTPKILCDRPIPNTDKATSTVFFR